MSAGFFMFGSHSVRPHSGGKSHSVSTISSSRLKTLLVSKSGLKSSSSWPLNAKFVSKSVLNRVPVAAKQVKGLTPKRRLFGPKIRKFVKMHDFFLCRVSQFLVSLFNRARRYSSSSKRCWRKATMTSIYFACRPCL